MSRLSSIGHATPIHGHTVPLGSGIALLSSKLSPPDPAHATVARRRLLTLLSQEVQRAPLTLLSGPAGSGKTVLAASWRQHQDARQPIGWLTLDDYDDDPATFWAYVVAALSYAGVRLSAPPALVAGEPPPGQFIPRLAADLAALARPVVLVLDRADHLTDRSIIAGLDLLLSHAGGRLRLVLCARADPLLPLHRYRLAGTLAEIRTDQLSFTAEETRDLLGAMGVPVTPEVAQALTTETQGWAVGLRLAAAPLKQGVPPQRLVTSLAHDDGSVAQYLFAEVLEGQPAGVRRVLLRASVTAELWPDLVDRLCGRRDVRRVLVRLAHANAFVEESPGTPGGFQIHPLFREMLQAQLGYEHPGELTALHRTCAAWYVEAGRVPDAVGHAVAAGDWGFVTRLMIDDLLVIRLLAHGADPAMPGLRTLPAGLRSPEAAVIRAVAALVAGQAPSPEDLAQAAGSRGEDARPALRVSATVACLVANAGSEERPESILADIDAAAALVAGLPEDDGRSRRDCTAVLSDLRALATLRTDAPAGQLSTALRTALTAAQSAGSHGLRRSALSHLALVEALEGHLTRAAELAGEAEESAAEDGLDEAVREPSAATALAWVHMRRYALVEAREWLGRARARERAATAGGLTSGPLQAVLQAQNFRLRHEYDLAEQVLRPQTHGARLPRWTSEQVVSEVVRLAVARGHVDDGLAMLRDRGSDEPWSRRLRATVALVSGDADGDALDGAEQSASSAAAVESAVIRACQLLESGRVQAAADELVAALDLARPEVQRWPFVDTPPQARRLLRTHPRLQAHSAWLNPSSGVQPLRNGNGSPATPRGPVVVHDLSDREMEVLRYLAEMLSTAEIAATMFISVNTVRTHIRSILRKLAVSRRNQAVRRARERGLL